MYGCLVLSQFALGLCTKYIVLRMSCPRHCLLLIVKAQQRNSETKQSAFSRQRVSVPVISGRASRRWIGTAPDGVATY